MSDLGNRLSDARPGRLVAPAQNAPRRSLEEIIAAARASIERSSEPLTAPIGTAVVAGGRFDRYSIPTDPRERVMRVPIPQDVHGRPCYPREWLEYAHRAKLKAEHEARVLSNLKDREAIIIDCERNLTARAEVLRCCELDVVWFINHFVWTTDPRDEKHGADLPFVLYEGQEREARFYQDEYLTAEEALWMDEKSRAWGWTWLHVAAEPLWAWRFLRNYAVLLGGVNAPNVDDGGMGATHESHMGKIRFALNRLPWWMVPGDILTNKSKNKINRLQNPENGNLIVGRQYCDNWARQDRYTDLVADEGAWSLKFRAATMAFGNASRRAHVGSTPHGLDNEYASMRFDDSEKVVHTLPWPENPTLNVDTYWAWRKKYGPEKTAQERDIDYGRSSSAAILQEFDPRTAVVVARAAIVDPDTKVELEPAREALDYEKGLPLWVLADPGWDDAFAIAWVQACPRRKTFHLVDHIQYQGRAGPFFVPFLTGYIPDLTHENIPWGELYQYDEGELEIIRRHAAWNRPSYGLGDEYGHSGASKMASGYTLYEGWRRYGAVGFYPVPRPNNKTESVQLLVTSLHRWRIAPRLQTQRTQSKEQPTAVECFQQYSWVVRESPTGRELKREPKHDKFCHLMDCLQFFMRYQDPIDPLVESLPPHALRGPGRDSFPIRRSEHDTPDVGEYHVEDDPILQG